MSGRRVTRKTEEAIASGATVVTFGGTKSRPAKQVIVPPPKSNTVNKRAEAIRLNVAGRKTRPPYIKMVKLAIASNKAHWLHGTSYAHIAKYILENYPTNATNFRRLLRVTLSRAVSNGQIEKTGNRYKYTKTEWEKDKAAAAKASARQAKAAAGQASAPTGTRSRPAKPKKRTTAASAGTAAAPKKRATSVSKAAPKKAAPARQRAAPKARSSGTQAAPAASQTQAKGGLKWSWQYYDNGWFNYDPNASDVVEANYQDFLKNPGHSDVRAVHSGQWNYMVDFRQMQQQNIQHENHTRRKIRRVQLPVSEIHNRNVYAENHFGDASSDDDDSMSE